MVSNHCQLVLFSMFLLLRKNPLSQPSCQQLHGLSTGNKTFEISIMGHRNQSGHWMTQFLLNDESLQAHQNWKMDLKHSTNQFGGVHAFHIKGAITVPPPRPYEYEHIPGVGYYKFHYGSKLTFQEAHLTCNKEGGHLAIINSQEEANALKTIYTRHSAEGGPWSYLGFYDQNKAGDFVTIYGQPLRETGFTKWHPGQPEDAKKQEFCGCFIRDSGLLADVGCGEKLSFFCEYDLSWSTL